VRDEHEGRLFAETLLPDTLDRHAVATEELGDLGEHTGAVLDVEVQVVLAVRVVHRTDATADGGSRRALHAAAVGEVPSDADEVADHRGP